MSISVVSLRNRSKSFLTSCIPHLQLDLLFVDLQQSKPGTNVLPNVLGERYPVINSVRSDFDVFLATLPDLASRGRDVMVRLQEVLTPRLPLRCWR